MPRFIAYPPTKLTVTGGAQVVNGEDVGLTVRDREAIAALASDTLLRQWAVEARRSAPQRSGNLARSLRPIPGRGLEVAFYGGFQPSQQNPQQTWLNSAWERALKQTPQAVRAATLRQRPDFEFRFGDLVDRVEEFAGTRTGEFVIDEVQRRAKIYSVALVIVRIGG